MTEQVLGSKKKKNRTKAFVPYLLIAPIVLWILFTIFVPLLSVIKESFYSTGFVGTTGSFIGVQNYVDVLTSGIYWDAWGKSALWVILNGFFQSVLAFVVALLLNNSSRISKIARTWMIVPWVIPTIVVAILWQWIFNSSYGILNQVLLNIGLIDQPLNLLGDADLSMFTVIFINSWHWFPFLAVIILAGLANVPNELYEASAVDGANKWQQFWKITFPSLQPITFAIGLVGTMWMFNIFDMIWFLTEGGPSGATSTVPVLIYKQAFSQYELGVASAMSVVTAAIMFIFAMLFIKFAAPKGNRVI